MNKSVTAFACFVSIVGISATAALAAAEPLVVHPEDTIEKLLVAQKGKVVTVRVGCDAELTGKVASVSAEVVQLSELTGKEFYDAAIRTADISSVVIRTR